MQRNRKEKRLWFKFGSCAKKNIIFFSPIYFFMHYKLCVFVLFYLFTLVSLVFINKENAAISFDSSMKSGFIYFQLSVCVWRTFSILCTIVAFCLLCCVVFWFVFISLGFVPFSTVCVGNAYLCFWHFLVQWEKLWIWKRFGIRRRRREEEVQKHVKVVALWRFLNDLSLSLSLTPNCFELFFFYFLSVSIEENNKTLNAARAKNAVN